jgi:dTDP-4-amino-4,6-dideoxygalactose transaminase
MTDKTIYVTKPYLPPLEEFIPYLEKIWESKILTNGGPFHQQLEQALCDYLGVDHISLFANGTLALMTALQALELEGEIITTPYSFVATSNALLWNKLTPVFVDIDPETLNLDARKIEAVITPKTTAILPVHCYGNPCDVSAIKAIADRNGLRVIYDAAHAFGVRDQGGSILRHGDLSILSFHATKVFNTFEGGAIISPDAETKKCVDLLKNFGIVDETTVVAAGLNGKMSELNAAFGLLQLNYIDAAITARQAIDREYRELLNDVPGIRCLERRQEITANYSYFPVLVENDFPLTRDDLYENLREKKIFARRYFYPLISQFPEYGELPSAEELSLPNAKDLSSRILCLPIYPAMTLADCERVVNSIVGALENGMANKIAT